MISIFEYIAEKESNNNDPLSEKRVIFCEIAIDVLDNLSSISPLESTFNGLKLIHTTFKNRLAKKRLAKLLKTWFNRRRLKKSGVIR